MVDKTCKKCLDFNCQICTSSLNYCSLCKSGYLVSSSGICESCGEQCTSCDLNGTCLGCADRYTLIDGYCQ